MEQKVAQTKGNKRVAGAQQRRQAIVDAALEEFLEKGFSGTRIEDVTRRAGVAKGTMYLHFADKQALFEGMVKEVLAPLKDRIEEITARPDFSLRLLMDEDNVRGIDTMHKSRLGDVMRLLIAEGLRFPSVAEFYFREFIEPMLDRQRCDLAHARDEGDLAVPEIVDFPYLLSAPMMLALIWEGLFSRYRALDLEGMLRVFNDMLFIKKPEIERPPPSGSV